MGTIVVALVLVLAPAALTAPTEIKCDGPNEHLVQVGGGCFVDEKGVQQCLPPRPPTCECASGFQRNETTKKCEKAVTSVRAGRSVDPKECTGPNERLVAITGGCRVEPNGQPKCEPAKPPVCLCEVGFDRNPANNKCEIDAPAKKVTRSTPEECSGPNESLVATLGGCKVKPDGQPECEPGKPPVCLCNTGFVRNEVTKKCEAVPKKVTRSTQEECSGPNESLVATLGGCIVKPDGQPECKPGKPPVCLCNTGFIRNEVTKKCDPVPAKKVTRSTPEECNGPNESLIRSFGGCVVKPDGKPECKPGQPPVCLCNTGFIRNEVTKKCDPEPAKKVTRSTQEECNRPNESLVATLGGCKVKPDGQPECEPGKPPVCLCNTGFIRDKVTKLCYPEPAKKVTRSTQEECNGPNESLVATLGGCIVKPDGQPECKPGKPPVCLCNTGFVRNEATKQCEALKKTKN